MSRFGFYDNPAARQWWEKFLVDYSPVGIKVDISWPIHAKGEIIEQKGAGPGAIFMVRLDEPIRFDEYTSKVIPSDYRSFGEEGTRRTEALRKQLVNMGCIEIMEGEDLSGQWQYEAITCIWTQWIHTKVIGFRRGLPVNYVEHDPAHVSSVKVTPGIVQNVIDDKANDKKIVEFFLFEPTSWMFAPTAINTDYLKPEHVSRYTDRMIDSTYLRWKKDSPDTLPPANQVGEEYRLSEPIELDQVRRFCGEYVEQPEFQLRCWLGAAMFHVLPIDLAHGSGVFRPMREEEAGRTLPYIVTREDIERAAGE